MLAIKYKDGATSTWYVNDKGINPNRQTLEDIIYIQADGHELEHIKIIFTVTSNMYGFNRLLTIPFTDNVIMTWYGDLAKTILVNLK